MKKVLIVILVAISLSACSTKINFEQTCLTCINSQRLSCTDFECPVTSMIDTNCIVVMSETGEKIFMNDILKQENISPRSGINLTIAKIRGRYFVTGEGLKHLWMLKPVENMAKSSKFIFPVEGLTMPPVFEISNRNLLMRGSANEYSYIFDIDKEEWLKNSNYPKAGN